MSEPEATTSQAPTPDATYDSPWKLILDDYLEFMLALLYPALHGDIDWRRGYKALDAELQAIGPDAAQGTRLADKLFQVWLKNGKEAWILIHIEVQAHKDEDFEERMFVSYYRIFDNYHRQVVSLAILGDTNRKWRPESYSWQHWKGSLDFRFNSVKLLDYQKQWGMLEASNNPFAIVIMAHSKALSTRNKADLRSRWKMRLIRELYNKAWEKQRILDLFRFIDWVMALPEELDTRFKLDLQELEEAKKVRYVTSIERLARKEATLEVLHSSISGILERRFGTEAQPVAGSVSGITDAKLLHALLLDAATAATLEEFRRQIDGVHSNA